MSIFRSFAYCAPSCLIAALFIPEIACSAPPNLTYLYPSGGQRGSTVEVTAGGAFERWPVQVWASDRGISAKAAKDKGKLSVSIAADTTPGVQWIRLHDEQGASTLRPFVVGTLPEIPEKEPNDEGGAAQPIETSSVINGRLEKAGDVDSFQMNLKKGQTLVASLDAHRTLRSPMDSVLQIVSQDGFVVEQNNDWSELDPRIVLTAAKEGVYIVRVFAFPSMPDSSIRFSGGEAYIYRLTMTVGAFAEYAVPLAVERTSKADITLEGWNLPAKNSFSLKPGDEFGVVDIPLLSNAVRVRLMDHPCWKAPRPAPLVPPFSLSGRLEKPDMADTVRILGKKGQALNVRVESREFGLMVNPVIRVLDAMGKQLARVEPPVINKDAELNFNPAADGEYRVEVKDLHGGHGMRFAYHLRVTPPKPDFAVSVASDRFALTPGKPLDIPITIAPLGGFTKDLVLTVEGLPDGVKAESLPPGKDGRMSLRLTRETVGPSGAFRILGHSTDPKITRTTRAPLAEFDTTTTDLWLAVGGEVPQPKPKKKR